MDKNNNNRAVIFDMDGTIWDSSDQVAEAWLSVLAENGLEGAVTKKNIQDCMGLVMDEFFDRLLPQVPERERRRLQYACEAYENEYLAEHCGRVYEGLEEAVRALRTMGLKTLIVTNAQDGYVQAFLKGSGMHELFDDYEMYGRTGLLKAQNIRLIMERNGVKEAVYVGDTSLDQSSADEAGCAFIFASYGFGSVENAGLSAASPLEIPALVTEAFE
ncbi:MAG: HAD family hydrolase [Firmicutes bacterium]|nr:HAD family hydrolase [Bacillota bacterium]